MKKNVIITTDSVCDMPKELLERYQVRMIPLTISEGDHSYKDGVDFTPDDIYELYDSQHLLPKTSAISPQEFIDFFTPLTQDGSEVVHIDISSACSATYQNACMAASELEGVYPVDSLHLTLGQGLLVIEACRLRDASVPIGDAVRELERMAKKAAEAQKEGEKPRPTRRIPYFDEVELSLHEHLGRKVRVAGNKTKGTLQIEFYGEEDLQRLMASISFREEE